MQTCHCDFRCNSYWRGKWISSKYDYFISNFDHSHVSNLLQRSKKVTNASLNSKWTCYSLMISFWWQQQRMALNKPSHFVWQWCRKTSLPQNSNGDWLKKRTTRFTVVLLKIAHYVCLFFKPNACLLFLQPPAYPECKAFNFNRKVPNRFIITFKISYYTLLFVKTNTGSSGKIFI